MRMYVPENTLIVSLDDNCHPDFSSSDRSLCHSPFADNTWKIVFSSVMKGLSQRNSAVVKRVYGWKEESKRIATHTNLKYTYSVLFQ